MNERIQELLKQAVNAVDNPFPGNPLNDELAKMYIPDCFAEKFALLIVRECATAILEDHSAKDCDTFLMQSWAKGMRYSASVIKQHFGVE